MRKQTRATEKKIITRREFLIGSGAVMAAIALSACAPKTTTTPATTSTQATIPTKASSTTTTASSSTTTASSTMTTASSPTTQSPKPGGILRVIYKSGPAAAIGYPPELEAGGASNGLQFCMEPLLHGNSKGGVSPWLAESFKVADDSKSITFNLKKDVKFHDGSDFNAEIAKWNLDNMINAKKVPEWASVDIIDTYTIRVNLAKWTNTVLNYFGDDPYSWMISKATSDKYGIDYVRKNPVGTGPFKFVSFALDDNIKFTKNPNYWQKGKPYLEGVEWHIISDPTTRRLAMETGQGDMCLVYPDKTAHDMEALGLKLSLTISGITCLEPDTANSDSPWANQKVREAAEYAIDREGIAKAFGYGYFPASYQLPSPGSLAYNTDFSLARKYDSEKARQLLAEAGYSNGFETTLITSPFARNNDITAAIQTNLAEIKIKASIENPDPGSWVAMIFGGGTWHNAMLLTGGPIFANFNSTLAFWFLPGDVVHKSWLRTPEFTQALNASLEAPTPDGKLISAVTDLLIKDASLIPVYYGGEGWALKPYIMDIGLPERSLGTYLNSEQAWLNK